MLFVPGRVCCDRWRVRVEPPRTVNVRGAIREALEMTARSPEKFTTDKYDYLFCSMMIEAKNAVLNNSKPIIGPVRSVSALQPDTRTPRKLSTQCSQLLGWVSITRLSRCLIATSALKGSFWHSQQTFTSRRKSGRLFIDLSLMEK